MKLGQLCSCLSDHTESYTCRDLDWLPTSKHSRRILKGFYELDKTCSASSWLPLSFVEPMLLTNENGQDNESTWILIVSNTSRRGETSKMWREMPIFHDVQMSLDFFLGLLRLVGVHSQFKMRSTWPAQCTGISADFRFSMHVTLWQWGNALWQLVCNTLQLGEKEHEGVNTWHAYFIILSCWAWMLIWECSCVFSQCWIVLGVLIFSMYVVLLILAWRQLGSCRPFCKLQVCVRDDREVRDESCRSFTRNFGGTNVWCRVWLRWNNAKLWLLRFFPSQTSCSKKTNYVLFTENNPKFLHDSGAEELLQCFALWP